jgi:outer membrane protein TolC
MTTHAAESAIDGLAVLAAPAEASAPKAIAHCGSHAARKLRGGPQFQGADCAERPMAMSRAGLPASTAASEAKGGDAQRFVEGLDIPGQWWTLVPVAAAQRTHRASARAQSDARGRASSAAPGERNARRAARHAFSRRIGSLGAQRSKSSGAAIGEPQLGSYYYTLNSASVNVSYGIDAFGGTRRQIEALQAQSDYQRYALEASYLSLTANIVTPRSARRRCARKSPRPKRLRSRSRPSSTSSAPARGGRRVAGRRRAAASDAREHARVIAAAAQSARAAAQPTGDLYRRFARGISRRRRFTLDSLTLPADLPVSLPSKLVEQRPDVREYSALLHAATAQVGVATANMLPQITLTGSFGGEAVKFSTIFSVRRPRSGASHRLGHPADLQGRSTAASTPRRGRRRASKPPPTTRRRS